MLPLPGSQAEPGDPRLPKHRPRTLGGRSCPLWMRLPDSVGVPPLSTPKLVPWWPGSPEMHSGGPDCFGNTQMVC